MVGANVTIVTVTQPIALWSLSILVLNGIGHESRTPRRRCHGYVGGRSLNRPCRRGARCADGPCLGCTGMRGAFRQDGATAARQMTNYSEGVAMRTPARMSPGAGPMPMVSPGRTAIAQRLRSRRADQRGAMAIGFPARSIGRPSPQLGRPRADPREGTTRTSATPY